MSTIFHKLKSLEMKGKAISTFITGIILIIAGIVLAIVLGSFKLLILSAFGVAAILFSLLNWKLSNRF